MMSTNENWVPLVAPGWRILVIGASGGIGRAVTDMLLRSQGLTLGLHRCSAPARDLGEAAAGHTVLDIKATLDDDRSCTAVVDRFHQQAGGIDALVVLNGGVASTAHWMDIDEADWDADLRQNLSVPFFLSRAAMRRMDGGGRIVLTGTESALHGGGDTTFAYGIAKRGTECMVQGLARAGAGSGILVNGVRLGFIDSGFHRRWKGAGDDELRERAAMVPLQRAGTPEEAAATIVYLLSGWAGFITGQMMPVTGGDWL